jgi:hypothetical protein
VCDDDDDDDYDDGGGGGGGVDQIARFRKCLKEYESK